MILQKILKGKNFCSVEMLFNKLSLLKIPSFTDISDSNFIEFVSKFGDFKMTMITLIEYFVL
jgi:hypothetical protein